MRLNRRRHRAGDCSDGLMRPSSNEDMSGLTMDLRQRAGNEYADERSGMASGGGCGHGFAHRVPTRLRACVIARLNLVPRREKPNPELELSRVNHEREIYNGTQPAL
jgi:hypothetical protein